MALTELKSDLSKFRKPVETPPIENQSVGINRKSNLTPLSDLSKKLNYPTNFTFTPEFTTPNLSNVDFIPNTDAKGFTAKMKQTPSQFVDIDSKQNTFKERIKNSKLGAVNFFSNDDAEGFTKKFNPGTPSQFKGISPDGGEFTSNRPTTKLGVVDFFLNDDAQGFTKNFDKTQFTAISPDGGEFTSNRPTTKLGVVDFFLNDDAQGFTKNFVDKTKSQFRGISPDGEKFTSPKVTFSGDFGLSFLPGSKIKLEGSAAKYYQVGSQKWQPGGKRYEDKYVSIGDLLIKENSPSYLTKIYSQFNLQDDSFNPYPLFFRQPFILRGIQRKGNSKKEPQKWGFDSSFDSIMGVDLIRGGVLTSTERALVDVARIGQFILSPKGIAWSIMQVGMQATNTYNKLWTPLNLLLAVGGQHIGLKPKRHGLLPFDKIDVGNYERAFPFGRGKYKDKLEDFRKNNIILRRLGNFGSNVLLETQFGGPESVYGIGISTIRTSTNTFSNPEKTYGDTKAGFVQKYNPIFENQTKTPRNTDKPFEDTYENKAPTFADDAAQWEDFGLSGKILNYPGYNDTNLFSSDNKNTLKGYADNEALDYKTITNLSYQYSSYATDFIDFRTKYKKEGSKREKLKAGIREKYFGKDGKDYYKDYNIEKRVKLGKSDTTIGISTSGGESLDLIKLSFTTGDEKVQFRGTVNSISETYSPTWTEIKYSGRAENAYLYDTFGRELNFGFRVYAYSVDELKPMWERLSALGKMTMPTYGTSGYYGNITKFTLGTMYKEFPALISSLQYAVPDEFTWEIGLNEGSKGNELPMGVDVTIGLKLLGKKLHSTENTPIYDYK